MMKSEVNTGKSRGRHRQEDALRPWTRLQVRMTMSFVMVSVATALFLELLLILLFVFVIARQPFVDTNIVEIANSDAQVYALEASVQAAGGALDPRTTFQAGQPTSLATPNIVVSNSNSQSIDFALLISPGGQVLASSDPEHHPVSQPVARALPDPQQEQIVRDALSGKAGSVVKITDSGHIAAAAQPVLNKQKQPIGAIYVQMMPSSLGGSIFSFAGFWLFTALFWLILTAPVGALFGMLTTRGLVRRLHRLNKATAQFAEGDYSQRVAVTRQDEIVQLERQFNSMAEQLVESIAQQKAMSEQHARLEERARIEQELLREPHRKEDSTASWSLSTLQRALREAPDGLRHVSTFTIVHVLHEAGYSWQQSRTWCKTGTTLRKRKDGTVEESYDPYTQEKKR